MKYDVIIVGGGIAGLTSAAYLSKAGHQVLLCEKESEVGGLVNSYNYKGFTFDGGIRSIENSGIIFPMLRQLGIEIPFVTSTVSLGIEDEIIKVDSKDSLVQYQELLNRKFPDEVDNIQKIINEIKKIMKYMDVLYGIDNPLFMDMMKNKKYLFLTVIPWSFKFLFTIGKINKLSEPVEEYLHRFTNNEVLIDMIAQHFFQKTPTFFALSYFSLYLDYKYPQDGTGMIVDKLYEFIKKHHGTIQVKTEIVSVDPSKKEVVDSKGDVYQYNNLIWASDLKRLYSSVDESGLLDSKIKSEYLTQKEKISNLRGGDSILSVNLTVDLDSEYFNKICSPHFFYTPKLVGLNNLMNQREEIIQSRNKEKMMSWAKAYYDYTTFEISIPALRNSSLAPKGKVGLIVSTLMDYDFVKVVRELGFYDEFKRLSETHIIEVLDKSVFPGLQSKVIDTFSSTPLTIESRTGNQDGAITGWAFTNKNIPVVSSMSKVAKSVLTPLPNIYQAGQWSYSPAGLPISVLTGKLAADKIK